MARKKTVVVSSTPVPLGTPEDIQKAWRMLAGGAPHAVQTLVDISMRGHSEVARVQASMTILDRVNLGSKNEVIVRAVPAEFDQGAMPDDAVSPSVILERRMKQLAAATESGEPMPTFADQIVDAELVEEPTWTETPEPVVDPWSESIDAHRPLQYGETPEPDEQ